MARQVSITVTTALNRVVIAEFDGANPISRFETGFGAWTLSSAYSSLTTSGESAKLHCLAGVTGEFKYSDISDCEINGADVLSPPTTLRGVIDALAPYIFSSAGAATPLPSGAATSAKQDTQTTAIGLIAKDANLDALRALVGEVQASPTANTALDRLKALNTSLGLFKNDQFSIYRDDTSEEWLIGVLSRNSTTQAGFTRQLFLLSTLAAHTPAGGVSSVEQYQAEILLELYNFANPVSQAITQLLAQSDDSGYIDVTGKSKGSINWAFTLGAGTNGLGTLYGNNDGTDASFDVAIGNTGSQTADAAGVISWDAPWKYVKFVFTTQTGAGSTFDGSIYAL